MHSCLSPSSCVSVVVLTAILAEIPLVFGTHFEYRGNSTELEWQTSYAMECECCGLRWRVAEADLR